MVTKASLQSAIDRFAQAKILVVGDVAIDEMIYGTPTRLSREAPVLILTHHHTDILLGAGTNAAHNLAKLGAAQVTMVGLAGQDYHASLLFDAMQRDGVSSDGIVQDASRPTTTKSRISGQSRQSVMQQIVRIDREQTHTPDPVIEQQLIDKLTTLIPQHQAVIISDYKLGVLTDKVIAACLALTQQHQVILAVDSHRPLACFPGATIATPNLPEAEANLEKTLATTEDVVAGGVSLRQSAQLQNLLITRGAEGMTLFDMAGAIHHIPVFNKSEVFDVTGAGDTVIATLTLAMATGSSVVEAAVLGNLAASIVVKKYATATTTIDEMQEALQGLDPALLARVTTNPAPVNS